MKKRLMFNVSRENYTLLRGFRIIITCILLIGLMPIFASVYSQEKEINIKYMKSSIKDVLRQVEEVSDYSFVYNDATIDVNQVVLLQGKNNGIVELLDGLLTGTNIVYKIVDNKVILHADLPQLQSDQQKTLTLSGSVTDNTGEPLPGVNVFEEENPTNGVITGIDGKYVITVSSDQAQITFSYIGFEKQTVQVAARSLIDIVLLENVRGLDEVVVVGFGSAKKENITGATSFVKMDQIIKDRPITNSAQVLQGVSAGLQVVSSSGQPGSTSTSLNIRGMTSINGGSPLVLVNNVPIDDLNDINPRDIESVSVLKDAAASSIYGARAAFGVILITTKSAEKNQPMKFQYATTTSLTSPMELPEKATTRQFVDALLDFGVYEYFAGQDVDTWSSYLDTYENNPEQLTYVKDPVRGKDYAIVVDESGQYYPLADTDVIGDFLNDFGYSTIHNFTMSGGAEKISYRVNAGYSFEDGVMITDKDSYENFNVNALLNADLTEHLSSSTNIIYRSSLRSQPQAQYSQAIQRRMYDPTGHIDLMDPTGSLGLTTSNILPFDTPGNIVRYSEPGITNNDNIRIFQKLELDVIKNLTVTGEYTFEKGFYKFSRVEEEAGFASSFKFVENSTPQQRYENTKLFRSTSDNVYHGLNIYTKYKVRINNHLFNFLAGYNREKKTYKAFNVNRKTLITVDQPSLNLGLGEFDGGDSYYDWAVLGYFGRVNYNYNDKYFIEVNGRYDGSSSFAEDDRFVLLPSVSGGWNIAKEDFMSSFNILSMLKLRASWGEIGNQLVRTNGVRDYYPYIAGYEQYNPYWIDRSLSMRYTSFNPAQLVSGGFTWEKVQTTNVGLDVSFFDNRLGVNVDLYSRKTLGMLNAGVQLPAVLGTDAPKQNIADLEVRGWEIELKWNDRIGQLRYGINVNLSNSDGEITKFLNEGGLISQYYTGQKIGEIWGYVTDGYYTVDDFVDGTLDAHLYGPDRQLKEGVVYIENAPVPLPGDVKYRDLNGDGMINNGNGTIYPEYDKEGNLIAHTGPGDRKVIGNNSRKYQFGINGFAEYKGFDFSFVLSGVGKRDLWTNSDLVWPYPSQFDHIYAHQLDYWTPNNQDAFYPRIYGDPEGNTNSNYGRNRHTQTKYLLDGSYLKIQNITLGYTLPKNVVNKVGIDNLRVFVSGDNIYTFDHLPKGMEADQINPGRPNEEYGAYPFMRNFSMGLNLIF